MRRTNPPRAGRAHSPASVRARCRTSARNPRACSSSEKSFPWPPRSRPSRGSARALRRPEGGFAMSEMNHPQALGSTRLGFADEGELDRFAEKLEAFERGEGAPDAWRAVRMVHGGYGQRPDGPMLARCEIRQGVLTPERLLA